MMSLSLSFVVSVGSNFSCNNFLIFGSGSQNVAYLEVVDCHVFLQFLRGGGKPIGPNLGLLIVLHIYFFPQKEGKKTIIAAEKQFLSM